MMMISFPRVMLPEGALTEKELGELKGAVAGLAAGGNWKPMQGKVMGIQTAAGAMLLETKTPGGAMVGGDPMTLMIRHTGFAAYAPEYVRRLVEEVERLQKEVASVKGN
jgi:hypothetical protein